MTYTRRSLAYLLPFSGLAMQTLAARAGGEPPDGNYAAWKELETAWNPFAKDLNDGVFNTRQWERVKKALRGVGGCK